ncbi:MAG TPA: type II toxin-antitoxin system death-on-curing family toxin [Sphingomicrobium sp.]
MADWTWVDREVALAIHLEQLSEFGGSDGIRDEGLFDSAMARPENLAAYEQPDTAALAASYAFGLARNHAFVDGNKRTAAAVSITFLDLNGAHFSGTDAEIVVIFEALAAGEIDEDELASWFRERIEQR